MSGALAGLRPALWAAGWPVRALLLAAIVAYRVTLSGMLGGQCRFHPTCSRYAEEAVRSHGAVRGTWLAVRRVARCGPFTAGGPDPVPPSPNRALTGGYDNIIHSGGEAAG